jgi:hypothetical protein
MQDPRDRKPPSAAATRDDMHDLDPLGTTCVNLGQLGSTCDDLSLKEKKQKQAKRKKKDPIKRKAKERKGKKNSR